MKSNTRHSHILSWSLADRSPNTISLEVYDRVTYRIYRMRAEQLLPLSPGFHRPLAIIAEGVEASTGEGSISRVLEQRCACNA